MSGAGELHEVDPIRGLPELLPEGERILWQGQPQWWSLGQRVFHIRLVIVYFVALILWRVVSPGEADPSTMLAGLAVTAALGVAAVGLLMLLAALICRTTIYTVTNRRVAMQLGVALPINLNLPFKHIESAGHGAFRDGTGDIPLRLSMDNHVAYLLLWPHARPWRVRRPEPMLRCVADSAAVAATLATALAQYHGGGAEATAEPDASATCERAVAQS